MKLLSAYLLAVLGGNATPSKDEVRAIVAAGNGEVDDAELDTLFAELDGKDINELVNSGLEKLSGVSLA